MEYLVKGNLQSIYYNGRRHPVMQGKVTIPGAVIAHPALEAETVELNEMKLAELKDFYTANAIPVPEDVKVKADLIAFLEGYLGEEKQGA